MMNILRKDSKYHHKLNVVRQYNGIPRTLKKSVLFLAAKCLKNFLILTSQIVSKLLILVNKLICISSFMSCTENLFKIRLYSQDRSWDISILLSPLVRKETNNQMFTKLLSKQTEVSGKVSKSKKQWYYFRVYWGGGRGMPNKGMLFY